MGLHTPKPLTMHAEPKVGLLPWEQVYVLRS